LLGHIRPFNLGAFLRDARPMGVDENGVLVLGFQHDLHRDNIDKDANRQVVEEFLSKTFSQRVVVRCVMAKAWQPTTAATVPQAQAAQAQSTRAATPPSSPPAQQPRAQAPPLYTPPPDPFADDELVQMARERLDAEAKLSAG